MSERGLTVNDPASWARVLEAAREQASADIIADGQATLALGQPIAWSVQPIVGKATHGLSSVHRVGMPKGNEAYTVCDVPIPAPAKWLSLSPALVEALTPCGFCEGAMSDHAPGIAA